MEALQVMADPCRWQILRELASSDRRVSELTQRLGQPQNLVSYHLRELRDAGLVSSRRSSFDGRDAYYRVDLTTCGDRLREAGMALDPGLRFEWVPPTPRLRRGRKPKVLFLCTGNSARSQMAEALLEHRSAHAVEARSAGSAPKQLHPKAVRVMNEHGINISAHATKHFSEFAGTRFDRVVTLCDKVREVCPEFPGAEAAHWSIPDPSAGEQSLAVFRAVADDLEVRVRHLVARLASA